MESVLVVGAGPVGLMAALWLAKLGVPVRIVEKNSGGSEHSKALALHANSLELLQRLGVADPFLELGQPMRRIQMCSQNGKTLADVKFDGIDSPHDYILVIEQSQSEALLRMELSHAGVEVEWGTELERVEWNDAGCKAFFTDGQTSSHAYVIGCDGGPSTVRQTLGIDFEGEKIGTWFVLADVRIEWDEPPREGRVFLGPDGPSLFLPLNDEGWYRIIATLPDAASDERPQLNDELFEELALTRCPRRCDLHEFRWQSSFQVRRRLAKQYRDGRVFLAGDAAHTHSPVGGQGMNTGLADVSNLCWKIAAVLDGRAEPSLLVTYERERRPVARATLFATHLATEVGTSSSPLVQVMREHIVQFGASFDMLTNQATKRASMTEFSYSGPQFGHAPIRPADTELITHVESDAPSIAQRFEFATGPHPGHRAPDLFLEDDRRLLENVGLDHVLLLFDGLGPTAPGYAAFIAGCHALQARAPWVRPFVVAPDKVPDDLASLVTVIRDPNLRAHRRFGALSEAGYLVRPDNYVAWRGQPMDFRALFDFLDQ